jgi:hypothetical protein
MYKQKIDSLHQKAQTIKSYDEILKNLDKELEDDRMKKNVDNN